MEAEHYFTVCTQPIVFFCSSVDAHLGCPHPLASVGNAAMRMGVQTALQDTVLFPLSKHSKARLQNHMAILFLILGENSILFSIVSVPIYIPTVGGVPTGGVPFSPRSHQHVLFLVSLIIAILTGVR